MDKKLQIQNLTAEVKVENENIFKIYELQANTVIRKFLITASGS